MSTARGKIQVRIPARWLEVDVRAWMEEYSLDSEEQVKADVLTYYKGDIENSYPVTGGIAEVLE